MSAINNQPLSYNLQESQGFVFNVKRLPSVSYWCNNFKVPAISLPAASVPSPSLQVPYIGDHVVYEPLILRFQVDSNLQNWLEIHNWMTAIGNPTNDGKHYKELERNGNPNPYTIYSDVSVFKTDSQRNPVFEFTFHNAWPTAISSLNFESTSDQVSYLEAAVSFKYVRYTFKPIISYIPT